MLLLTMQEWFGPSKRRDPILTKQEPEETLRGFVTVLSLSEALARISRYEQAFCQRYATSCAINFRLVGVSHIDDLTDEDIERARVTVVEHMPCTADELGTG